MQAGFFNNPPKKSTAAQKTQAPTPKPVIEDVTHLKAQSRNERNKIDEIQLTQNAESLEKTKGQWLTPELLNKMMSKPHMMEVFQDPQFSQVIALMQKDPKTAMEKYGNNGKFREFMMEFSGMMATHFDSVAD